MSSSVKRLREILHSAPVEKMLINRATETPILENDIDLKANPTLEMARKYMSNFLNEMDTSADEVYPNLHIGNYKGIMDVDFLKSKKITHVLNVGEHDPTRSIPKIDPEAYEAAGIHYETQEISDFVKESDKEKQTQAFLKAADFIESILNLPDAKLVVNCFGGISRSSSVVITYLIEKKNMTAEEALLLVKKHRDVWPSNPNISFLAKISNAKHGFEDIEEEEIPDIDLRSIVQQKRINKI